MFQAILLIVIGALGMLGAGTLVFTGNTDILELQAKLLQSYSRQNPEFVQEKWNKARKAAIARVLLYRNGIMQDFLLDDMVVNRRAGNGEPDDEGAVKGDPIDVCDSLLFSSLLYVSFSKLGLEAESKVLMNGMLGAEKNGQWLRHPQCLHRLSRDMIVGVLAAMSQRPEQGHDAMLRLLKFVEKKNGYVGDGPFYVSYLSPGLAELARNTALLNGIRPKQIPQFFFQGYSTLEIDTLWPQRGFHSHLGSLAIWLEMELTATMAKAATVQQSAFLMRNLPEEINPFFTTLTKSNLAENRHQWLTYRLVKTDKNNLFFRYLHFRASGALTMSTRLLLLQDLLAMKQFPEDRLPSSCDRKADYMWQRDSVEWRPIDKGDTCKFQFNGVDFIWLTALLLEDMPQDPREWNEARDWRKD